MEQISASPGAMLFYVGAAPCSSVGPLRGSTLHSRIACMGAGFHRRVDIDMGLGVLY
jgi:hypothetical protein